jgi:conjugal transfer mating pair stabilization protein TraN
VTNSILLLLVLLSGSAWAAPSLQPNTCIQDKADSCIDTTPCKNINGVTACLAGTVNPPANSVMLSESCWQFQAAFTCLDTASVDTCEPLRDRGCGQIGTTCLSQDANGRCVSSTLTYSCPDKPPSTKETMVCEDAVCQADGSACFDTTRPADKDFGMAAAMMEASREAGVYGVVGGNVEIFKGFKEECSVKVLGGSSVKSCCEEAGGGQAFSNYNVIGKTAAEGAYAVGKEELKAGSKYVYDSLFQTQDAGLVQEGLSAAAGGLTEGAAESVAAQSGTGFGAYGFQFSYSAAGGFQFVGFDPTSFAIAVAMQIVTSWLACEPEEQTMQMKRGQKLCAYVDTYCSSKVLGACVERKQRHCCFNSVLAKLINRQGRAQLGLPMDQCGGFTQAQLQALDFSRIDLSEFIATIMPKDIGAQALKEKVSGTVDKKVKDYYGQ